MHYSVMEWAREALGPIDLDGAKVLDVGALDENGSLQPYLRSRGAEVTGVDMRPGPGVDVVAHAEDLLDLYEPLSFDLVVCTEMLEHADGWQEALHVMKRLVAPAGYLLVTTRGPGFPRHEFPNDYWRFTPTIMARALADMTCWIASDPGAPGVFALARGPRISRTYASDPCSKVHALPVGRV